MGANDSDVVESLNNSTSGSWMLKDKENDEIVKGGERIPANGKDYWVVSKWFMVIISNTGEINSDKNVIYDSSRGYAGIKLNSGDSLYATVIFRYPTDADENMSDNGQSEYFEFKLNHEFKWEQYTDSPNYESTTFDEWCFNEC